MANELAQITALLHELKSELQEVRADVGFLKEQVLEGKKPRRKYAVVTMPFTYEYDQPSITLTEENWNRVKNSETVQLMGKGLEIEGEEPLIYRWTFSGGIDGQVKIDVQFGEDGEFELAQKERLSAVVINEFDVAE